MLSKMAPRYVMEATVSSAKGLKNVNWRHGPTRPYAVLWVDPNNKCSTRADEEGDTSPFWDQTLAIPLPPGPIEYQALYIDVVHAGSEDDTEPLIGSARLKLRHVLDDVGFGEPLKRNLQLKRPSGRPHGKVEVKVCVREPRYRAPDPYRAPPYGVPQGTREYAPPAHVSPYPPGGYNYGARNPPPQPQYGNRSELAAAYGQEETRFEGIGMALAVVAVVVFGAVAGYVTAKRFSPPMDEIVSDTDEDENESEEEEEEEDGTVDAAEEDEDEDEYEDGVLDDAAVEEELDYDVLDSND